MIVDASSQITFLNRQALYLHPDPARVVVRPFKVATEPRDLNPTDKTRANHIVDRVLALDPEAAASVLVDILENFRGCPFRKLYPTILMVKSAQDGAGDNGTAALDWPMIRGILAQSEMSSCRIVI
jgi:hypothetical protein